ncbi:aminotransferase class IV, partial [Kaarinaea lacus]
MSNFLINGEIAEQLSVSDRGLHYGDGIFETIKIKSGSLQHWEEHMARLQMGCQRLHIPPADVTVIKSEAEQLISDRDNASSDAILKIIVTRGSGQRGYKLPV